MDAENRIQYVQKGEDSTLTLSDEYLWVDKNGNEADASVLESIEDTTTLYARPKAYTASFVYKETGATAAASISGVPTGGKLTITMPAAPGGYIWVNAEGVQVTASSVDIKGNTTFYAVPSVCTVRYYDTDGSTELSQFRQENVPYGTSVTLPALPEGASAWSDGTAKYAAGAVVPVTGNMSFTAVTRTLTLNYTLNYTDGDTEYDPSMDVSIGAPKLPNNATTQTNSITAADAPYTVIGPNYRSIHYSTGYGRESQSTYFLGWDMDGDNVVDIQPGEQLTWAALLALAGDRDTVTLNGVWDPTSINSTISFFIELNARAVDTGGTITGGSGSYTSLLYSTHVFDEQGENVNVTGNYTNVKENGGWVFSLAGDSELTSVLVDSQIRDLYGPGLYLPQDAAKEDQIRLYTLSFPSDQEILDQIREEGKTVYADLGLDENGNSKGREVVDDPDKLTTDYYTIRWYVIKPEGGSWHIDGKLVKKTGTIHVTKNIEGNASLVSAVEDYMKSTAYGTARPFAAAVCEGYYKPDGVTFVNYDSPRTVDLYFVPHGELTGADENNVGYTYDAATKTYSWDFEEVETNELWTITEYPPTAAELKDLDLVDLSEWITVDSISGTGDAGYNTSTSVSGIAHPADETTKAWMRAEFTNMYHKSGNLLLRKLDGVSGINLGSETTFNLFRESVSGMLVPMYFRQTDEGYWIFDSQAGAGSTADLTVDELGYLELEKFTYDAGDIHIRESVARSGYVPAPTVVMGTDLTTDADNDGVYDEEDGDEVSVVLRGYLGPDDELITDEESLRHYADFTQGVLSIRNYSSSSTTVTVQKNWRASENLQSPVQVTLYANGNLASTIPNFVGQYGDYVVWLDGTGSFTYSGSARNSTQYAGETETPWSHTWRELPSTVDGEAVTWTLVETRIGDEVPDSTGKFPNYTNTVTYTNAVDSDGNLVVNATVTNSVRAAQLFLTKVNESSNALSGATFTLTLLDDSGAADPAWTPRAVTTDSTGVLHFAGLRYETWYRLDETAAPAGYQPIAPIYIKLNSNGAVTATTEFEGFVNHGAVSETGTYTVTVTNVAYPPLPETGGVGTEIYTHSGALLMAAALLMLIYKGKDDLSDV